MRPSHLQSRIDLIELVRQAAPMRQIKRACDDIRGTVESLGAFSQIPPFESPGFVVRVTSRHRRTWIVAVVVDTIKDTCRVSIIEDVPWRHWHGRTDRKSGNPYDGDKPRYYARIRELARSIR